MRRILVLAGAVLVGMYGDCTVGAEAPAISQTQVSKPAGSAPSPAPAAKPAPVLIADDLLTDSRSKYGTSGEVRWEKNRLLLQPGARISRGIPPGSVAELTLDLKFAPAPADSETIVGEIGFETDGGEAVSLVLVRRNDRGKAAGEVRVMKRAPLGEPAEGKPVEAKAVNAQKPAAEVRRFLLPGGLPQGEWTIDQRYGLLSFGGKGEGRHAAYPGCGSTIVSRFFLAGISGSVELRRIRLRVEPEPALTDKQKGRLADFLRMARESERLTAEGKLRAAIGPADECVRTAREVLGEEHRHFAWSLNNRAMLYHAQGDDATGEPLVRRAGEIWRKVLGEDHPDYATSVNNLATILEAQGRYAQSERLHRRSLEIRKRVLGENHPDYAQSLNNLAFLHYSLGEYAEVRPLLQRALEVAGRTIGEDHPGYITCLGNLADFYESQGEHAEAERLYRRALDITRRVLGERHPHYATCLDRLATLLEHHAEYARAEPIYRQAAEIKRQALGEDHPQYGAALNNLAGLYARQGERAKAEPLYRRSLDITRRTAGVDHPDYANGLNNLAGLYRWEGRYAEAVPLYRQALAIWERAMGKDHPSYARGLHNLAGLHELQSEYAEAERLYREALDIKKRSLGERHPSCNASMNALAVLLCRQGKRAEAKSLAQEAFRAECEFTSRTIAFLPEARAMSFRARQLGCDPLLWVLRNVPGSDPSDAYKALMATRGLISRILSQRRQDVVSTPAAREILQDLQATAQQLARLTLAATGPEQRELRRKRLSELNDRMERLEEEMARVSVEFRRSRQVSATGLEDLVRRLPKGAAVVEFYRATVWNPPAGGKGDLVAEAHYDAFVLRADDAQHGAHVAWAQLGDSQPIDEAVGQWRQSLVGGERPGGSTHATKSSKAVPGGSKSAAPETVLRRLVWEKVEPHLAGCSTVIVVPDGYLCFVPWAAVPGRKPGTVLVEDYALTTASSAHQLHAALTESRTRSEGLLLIGGVAYDASPVAERGPAPSAVRSSDESAERTRGPAMTDRPAWRPLPGSSNEVGAIAELWPGRTSPVVLRAEAATETALRQRLSGSRFIHLATHGFFADEKFRSMFGHDLHGEQLFGGLEMVTARQAQVTARNPLILSGLVLAGANRPPKTDELGLPTGDDGILTAEEIVNLDLRGTELVVLSACDTGLGNVAGGEGVMGLTRAFHLAGARNVVTSLWKVDDKATAALMRLFYEGLWKDHLPPVEALRRAQLAIYRNPALIETGGVRAIDVTKTVTRPEAAKSQPAAGGPAGTSPPRLWAAFILSGPGR